VRPLHQALFAIAIAAVYGVLLVEHVVYGLFIALALVCGMRGLGLYAWAVWQSIHGNPRGPPHAVAVTEHDRQLRISGD
jgi:hypothetical protein